jgi:hypothetical protein
MLAAFVWWALYRDSDVNLRFWALFGPKEGEFKDE